MFGSIRLGRPTPCSPVEVTPVPLSFARLPAAFDGYRVALAADLHFGRHVGEPFARRVLELIAEQRPDLVLLGGDLVERPHLDSAGLTRLLCDRQWKAPTCAVCGNHDHRRGSARLLAGLREAGVDVLMNEHRLLRPTGAAGGDGSEAIALAGVDERLRAAPECAAALAGIREGTFTIVLTHNPDLADRPEMAGADLMLAGHTHGGQIAPFGWALVTRIRNRRYLRGLVRTRHFPLYVSRGLGVGKVPLRIGSDPELAVITLRRNST